MKALLVIGIVLAIVVLAFMATGPVLFADDVGIKDEKKVKRFNIVSVILNVIKFLFGV